MDKSLGPWNRPGKPYLLSNCSDNFEFTLTSDQMQSRDLRILYTAEVLYILLHIKKCLGVSPHHPNPCPGGSILIPRPEISRDFLMAAPKSSEGILAPHELLTDGPRQLIIRSDQKV